MALPGYYKVNFTDPRKEGFIIEPYQTNGAISPVSDILDANAPRANTSLLLYGRDVPNYGERIAENFVQVVENFAGPAAPQNAIEGQLWFDTGAAFAISAWSNANTLIVLQDVVDLFNKIATDKTLVTLSYKPANSATDNTFQEINLLVSQAINIDGATAITFLSASGGTVSISPSVVGGFITAEVIAYPRMRVATKVAGAIKWIDICNILSTTEAPEISSRNIGDLWYDAATQQLKIFSSSGWTSVAARYLPLDGGSMNGAIQMGTNKVFSQGTITAMAGDRYAYVNRDYVDVVQNDLQTQITAINDQIGDIEGTDLKNKVSKTGDVMTGTLVFGNEGATSTLQRGIDANNTPIIRPQITWSATDYLSAATQTNYVVDKLYVAKAIAQHLQDAAHGGGGFIQIQSDGSGVFPNDVGFSAGSGGKSYALSWFDASGNNKHSIYAQFSGPSSQLVLQAGEDSNDTIDFRHKLQVSTSAPLFRVGNGYTQSENSIFLHDGQPQPSFKGKVSDNNDDTAAAAKGFVRKYVADNIPAPTQPGTTVTDATYTYAVATKSYSLTIKQSDGSLFTVDEFHKHAATDVEYTYSPLVGLDWADSDPIANRIKQENASYPAISAGAMLDAMNKYKAPVTGAVFLDLPRVGIDATIMEYNSAAKTIRVYGDLASSVKVGATVLVEGSSVSDGTYTVASVIAGAIANNQYTTVITVVEPVPGNGVEANEAFLQQGAFAAADQPRELITRTTLDYEITQATNVGYLYFKATAAGTNVVKALGFSYAAGSNRLWVFRNGQKMRVNTMTGGDYNETSTTSVTIATVNAGDEFEIYRI